MEALKKFQTRAPLAYPLLALIVGLIGAKQLTLDPALSLAAGFISALSLAAFADKRIWYPMFGFAAALVFYSYGELRLPNKPEAYQLAMPPREVSLQIEVERVFQADSPFNQGSGIAKVLEAPWQSRLQEGDRVYCKIDLPERTDTALQRGQQIQATGVLTPLPEASSEKRNFESYLKAISIHYRLDRTSEFEELAPPSHFDRFCQSMNQKFQDWLQLGARKDSSLSNVYLAMLLGRKAELSEAQSDRYRMTGTMHFFAISGLHIGVIATVIAQALRLIRVPQWLSPLIGLPLVYCYVEITGAAPSAVRAFLMATFFWASFAVQRQRSPFAALIGSAFFVLLIDPEQLWSVGFQLSYSVVLSILLFGLPLNAYLCERLQPFRWLPPDSWNWRHTLGDKTIQALSLLFAISCSAWLASAPLSAAYFGFVASGAIVLNMLLVNLASLTICGGVVAITCGIIQLPVLTSFINHSAWICISLMDELVILFTKLPGAILHCPDFRVGAAYGILLIYFAALAGFHFYLKRFSQRWLWAAPAALLLLLTAGVVLSS